MLATVAMNSVCPSFGARATASAASMLLLPGRFSTTAGWPNSCSKCFATSRATMSALEPGPKPTMILTVDVG